MTTHGKLASMRETDEPEAIIAQLREEIVEFRKKRMAAQKTVATLPNLEVALERASRDRSSGATAETDALRDEIQSLREGIVHEVRGINRMRGHFPRVDAAYPTLAPRARLVSEFNQEAQWRAGALADDRSTQIRIVLPRTEEVT